MRRLRFWKRRRGTSVVESSPHEHDPLLLALDMIEAATGAPDRAAAVTRVAGVLRPVEESVVPLTAIHLAVLLAHPPSMPRTTPGEVAAWVDDVSVLLAFDALVAPLRDEADGSEG